MLLSLHDQTVEVRCPPSVEEDIAFLYRDCMAHGGSPGSCILVAEAADGRFSVQADGDAPVVDPSRGDLPTFVMEAVVRGLVTNLTTAVALHAGAIAHARIGALASAP